MSGEGVCVAGNSSMPLSNSHLALAMQAVGLLGSAWHGRVPNMLHRAAHHTLAQTYWAGLVHRATVAQHTHGGPMTAMAAGTVT